MNKEKDITALIRSIERIFGINENDPELYVRFRTFRRELEGFKIEVR